MKRPERKRRSSADTVLDKLEPEAARKKMRNIPDRLNAGAPAKDNQADTFKVPVRYSVPVKGLIILLPKRCV